MEDVNKQIISSRNVTKSLCGNNNGEEEDLMESKFLSKDASNEDVIELINKGQSEFKATMIRGLESTENYVFDVDQKYIVKFPTEDRKEGGIIAENKILNFLENKTTFPIPKSRLSDGQYTFSWYRKAEGIPVTPDNYISLPEDCKALLCHQVAEFMLQMHAIDTNEVLQEGITFSVTNAVKPKKMLHGLRENAPPDLLELAEKYLSRHEEIKIERTVFSHFDLHGDNIIVDPATGKVSSVIDFSNSNISDYNRDFHPPIMTNLGYYKNIVSYYNLHSPTKVDEYKVNIYAICHFLKILTYSYFEKNQEDIDWWTRKLKKWMYSPTFKKFD